ncbi:MAG: MraY family glycosyltransferase [Bacteroidota bacterium]|jgi:UDP-N-acetylmuramyl pentapeptide phosphotransferase/UDP-N-acetylglucosamine-1-phosphate transferase
MDQVFLGTIISFIITFSAIPIIMRVAALKNLFDIPDDRKIHTYAISSLGGVGIFAGFILGVLIVPTYAIVEIQYMLAAFLVIFFLGLKDDIVVLTPMKKFLGQVIAASLLMFKGNLMITGMHGFLGIQEFPPTIGIIFTFFTILVITNSFNLIDGVDGLAGTLGLFSTFVFGSYFLLADEYFYAILAFCMTGSLLAFLIFNVAPAKIFMGDTGSLLLGIVNSILVIKFIEIASRPEATLSMPSAPAIGFAVLFVPLFDTLRIFAYRVFHRRSPFSPDKNHVHHLLLEKGCSHPTVTLIAVLFNIIIAVSSFALKSLGNTTLLLSLISIGFISIGLLIYSNKSARLELLEKTFNRKQEGSDLKIIKIDEKKELSKTGEGNS